MRPLTPWRPTRRMWTLRDPIDDLLSRGGVESTTISTINGWARASRPAAATAGINSRPGDARRE